MFSSSSDNVLIVTVPEPFLFTVGVIYRTTTLERIVYGRGQDLKRHCL